MQTSVMLTSSPAIFFPLCSIFASYLEVSSSHALIFLLVVRVNDSYKQDISKSPKITVLGPLFAFYGQTVCVSLKNMD